MYKDGLLIKETIFRAAATLYKEDLRQEWSPKIRKDPEKAARWMRKQCKELSSVIDIPDDLLVLRFSSGLFANARTMLAICQQWERMALHTIAPDFLAGEGRVWILLLHLMICEPALELGIEPMFQDYQTMMYPMGMNECPLIELLYRRGLFHDSILESKHDEIASNPKSKDESTVRVMCPAFLRFDIRFLPTISGRAVLNFIGARKCFDSVGYQENSNVAYLQSCLKESLEPIYTVLFNHFRPCIVACMMVSICWACCSKGELYRDSMSECIAHFVTFLERLQLEIQQRISVLTSEEDDWERRSLRKIARRVSVLRPTIEYFQSKETQHIGAYSLSALDELFRARWNTVLRESE